MVQSLMFIYFGFGVIGCEQDQKVGENASAREKSRGELPIQLVVVRDGKTKRLTYKIRPEDDPKELWFVFSQSPKPGGDIYLNSYWDVSGAKPLVPAEAIKCLDEVENLLLRYHGDSELKKITNESERYNKMTVEEVQQSMKDSMFQDRFETSNAMHLVELFRGYLKEVGQK